MPTISTSQNIALQAGQSLRFEAGGDGMASVLIGGAPGPVKMLGIAPTLVGPFPLDANLYIQVNRALSYSMVSDAGTLLPVMADSRGNLFRAGGAQFSAGISPNMQGGKPWDFKYRAALARAKAGTGLCRVVWLGDSVDYQYYASNLDVNGYVARSRQALQNAYGDGGSGLISVGRTTTVLTADGRAAAIQNAWAAAGNLITLTGTWTETKNGSDCPGTVVITAGSVGATASKVVRGTTVEIAYQTTGNVSAGGNFTYQIDGGAVVGPINTYKAGGSNEIVAVTGLAPGNHTVLITATDSNGTLAFSLCGISGRNASGVVVDQCARGGQTSDALNTTSAYTWTAAGGVSWGGAAQNLRGGNPAWNGGASRPADLIIVGYGPNDATTDKTAGTLLNNHRMALVAWRDADPDVSVLFLHKHRGNIAIDGTTQQFGQYGRELYGLAQEYNCGFLNIWANGGNSLTFMNNNGYMSANNTVVGVSGTDGIHLSDAGQEWMASLIIPHLI